MIIASLLLFSLFIWPMWEIILLAPQYPDGVTMYIYINKIGGPEPGTLQNVNILNHYIGMKAINPDSIPELKYMPPIIAFMIAVGLLTALINNKFVYWAYAITFLILILVGLYDFYLWEYDYGHDLDPKAPMIFEGYSFQPPLIGTKKILNFTAISRPQVAGYLAGISLLLSFVAAYFKTKYSKTIKK